MNADQLKGKWTQSSKLPKHRGNPSGRAMNDMAKKYDC